MSFIEKITKLTSKTRESKTLDNFKNQQAELQKEEMINVSGGRSNQSFKSSYDWKGSMCSNIMYQ